MYSVMMPCSIEKNKDYNTIMSGQNALTDN